MTRIRIDTEQVREVSLRFIAKGNQMAEIGYELQGAIARLDTWAWDGASRTRAEPLLGRVGPESAQIAEGLDELGRKLVRAAGIFEYEDSVAAGHMAGMPWVDFDAAGPGSARLSGIGARIPAGAVATAGAALMGGMGVAGGLSAVAGRESGFWPPAWSWEGQLWREEWAGSTRLGGVRLGGVASAELLKGELGLGLDWDKAEAYARATAFRGEADGLVGSTDLGLGAHGELTVGEVEAVAEYSWSEGRPACRRRGRRWRQAGWG